MRYLISILFACWQSIWRRWKGTASDEHWYNAKWVKVVCNIILTYSVLFLLDYHWLQSLIATACFQFLFWTQAIGGALDIGRDYPPSEETIKRYKKKFWNKWCEFIVPEKAWYGYFYDFLWMFFRYELPAVLVALILWNPFFLLAGLTSALSYAIAWALYEKKGIDPSYAEYGSGFFAGLLLTL
ncbi:MAG: hypothetical protein KBT03_09545 [Bacteroidales bacterium]|nr:hypothetical protein [Candidatus Scybalousia scybalohippi]